MPRRLKLDPLVKARAVKAARRELANGKIVLEMDRPTALFLYNILDGMGDDRAGDLRRKILAQAFSV